jgi:hypothetical protein
MTPADDRPAPRYQLWRQDDNGNEFLVARFDHPKFPSDTARWEGWLAFLDERHSRAE